MIATPAALTAAATDIDGIGSAVSVANAAAVAA
ncbi:PE domain-containing protein, partial [Mycobacterium tuberculosis]